MERLPVIDLAALDAPDGAKDLDRACRDTGFFLVTGHGVPADLLPGLDAAARTFFARPDGEKAEIAMARGGRAWRGWFPEGGELTSGAPDHKEGLYFGEELGPDDPRVAAGTPLHGANLFPAVPAELRDLVVAWMDEMRRVGHLLARGISLGLGLPGTWLDDHVTADPTILFRIFRYPPLTPGNAGWGVGEHTDYGLLTILAHDGTPGLEVRSGVEWIPVPAVGDAFVVNIGDMLDRMTAGRYRSTPHRVRLAARPDGRDRLSFPFFFDPGWDVEVAPLPLDGDPPPDDRTDRWDGASIHDWSGTYGDYLTAKVSKVFPGLTDHLE